MPWFPVHGDELNHAERQLGMALPPRYKTLLSDPRVVRLLSHDAAGALVAGLTMQDFVDATRRFRLSHAGFPAAGVLATLPAGRYVRFWLPDAGHASTLGEMLYSWDTQRQRQTRDCIGERWVQSMIEVVFQSDPSFFAEVGYPPPVRQPPPPLFRTRRCDPALMDVLALRGGPAREAVQADPGRWWPCASLQIHGRHLVVCDLGQMPQPSDRAIAVEPGRFEADVRLKMASRGEWPVAAALRLLRKGSEAPASRRLDFVDVDTAAVAVHDRQRWQRRFRLEERDGAVDELMELAARPVVAIAGRLLEVLVVPSGEGDGRYPLFELLQGQVVVGLQIDFEPGR